MLACHSWSLGFIFISTYCHSCQSNVQERGREFFQDSPISSPSLSVCFVSLFQPCLSLSRKETFLASHHQREREREHQQRHSCRLWVDGVATQQERKGRKNLFFSLKERSQLPESEREKDLRIKTTFSAQIRAGFGSRGCSQDQINCAQVMLALLVHSSLLSLLSLIYNFFLIFTTIT